LNSLSLCASFFACSIVRPARRLAQSSCRHTEHENSDSHLPLETAVRGPGNGEEFVIVAGFGGKNLSGCVNLKYVKEEIIQPPRGHFRL